MNASRQLSGSRTSFSPPVFRVRIIEASDIGAPNTECIRLELAEPAPVYDELYLRELFDLDLTDKTRIVQFAQTWGWLGDAHQELAALKERVMDEDGNITAERYGPLVRFAGASSDVWRPSLQFLYDMTMDLQEAGEREEARGEQGWVQGYRHLDEFRLYARMLRNMARIWGTLSGSEGMTEKTLRQDWEPLGEADEPYSAWQSLRRVGSTRFLSAQLSAALQGYGPPAVIDAAMDRLCPGEPLPAASLYQALCMQLANHISTGSDYGKCSNCQRLFVRQRDQHGHVDYSRYRTRPSAYCSKQCAWAYAQREHRSKLKREAGEAKRQAGAQNQRREAT